MRKHTVGILAGMAIMMASGTTGAATLAQYEFTARSTASSDGDVNSTASNVDASAINYNLNNQLGTFEVKDNKKNNGGYLSFTLTPTPDYVLDLQTVAFTAQLIATQDSVTIDVTYSLDGFATAPLSIGGSNTLDATTQQADISIDLSGLGPIGSTGVGFRLNFQTSGTSNNVVASIDNIIVDGNATAVQLPPAAWLMGSGLLALVGIGRRTSR